MLRNPCTIALRFSEWMRFGSPVPFLDSRMSMNFHNTLYKGVSFTQVNMYVCVDALRPSQHFFGHVWTITCIRGTSIISIPSLTLYQLSHLATLLPSECQTLMLQMFWTIFPQYTMHGTLIVLSFVIRPNMAKRNRLKKLGYLFYVLIRLRFRQSTCHSFFRKKIVSVHNIGRRFLAMNVL